MSQVPFFRIRAALRLSTAGPARADRRGADLECDRLVALMIFGVGKALRTAINLVGHSVAQPCASIFPMRLVKAH